jgi:pentatricopeptide repeat protein
LFYDDVVADKGRRRLGVLNKFFLFFYLQLFEWMKENDKLSAPTYTSFFSVLGKGGRVEKALHVFNDLPLDSDIRRNVYVCNSVLSTLVYNGKVDKAFRLFEQLKQEGLKPDIITYSTVNHGISFPALLAYSISLSMLLPVFDWYHLLLIHLGMYLKDFILIPVGYEY